MTAVSSPRTTSDAALTPLVLIVDEAYAVGLAATLSSIVQHTQPLPPLLVVDAGLMPGSRRKLAQIAAIQWIELSKSSKQQLRQEGLLPPADACKGYPGAASWLKLALPRLLPAGLPRALYLDCDMLARTSLQPLLELDLQGHLLAAVRDVGHPNGHPELCSAGWDGASLYFNAGLLLLDLKKLGALSGCIASIIGQQGQRLRYHDQDVLNLLVASEHSLCSADCSSSSAAGAKSCNSAGQRQSCQQAGWVQLPLRWNAQGIGTYAGFRLRAEEGCAALFSSPDELHQYEAEPAVVHFTGPPTVAPSAYLNEWVAYSSKPWAYLCQHPLRAAFFEALDATPWHGWRPDQRLVAEACVQEARTFVAAVAAEQPGFDAHVCWAQVTELLGSEGRNHI